MKNTANIYQFSGLIAVLGLVALVVGFVVMILLPDIRLAAWGLLLLGVLLMSTAVIIDFRRVGRALTGRRGKFSTGTTVMAVTFIGITLLANAISLGNYHRFDVTGVSQFTLTQQTKDVIKNLKTPVKALAFFIPAIPTSNDPGNTAAILYNYGTTLLTEYKNSADKLSVEYIDPDENPDRARQYNITQYQTVVFETEKGRRLVPLGQFITYDAQGAPTGIEAEHAFTSAILEVTGTIQKKIYFLTGHGEGDISSTAASGYSQARESLLDNLYKVDTLDLTINPVIPDDAAALIVAGPQEPIPTKEAETIEQYLKSGKQALFMINPNPPKEIKQLLANWGITAGDGTVIDPSSYVAPSIDSPSVPSTRNEFGLPTIYFPGATAIIPNPEYKPTATMTEQGEILPQIIWKSENSKIQMSRLVWTSNDSWLEMNFNPLGKPEFTEGTDIKGPLGLSFLIFVPPSSENTTGPGTALIVIGDSDFVSNQHFFNGNNGDLLLNAVNLLTTGKEIISIKRRVLPFRRLVVGPEAANFIRISSIGLLPLIVLTAGVIIWWRRR
ncbi:MAG: GldG family protein [Chloroflexi bacterium]|nr:GldG family protein [Chloroflexota bacterium]